MAIGDNIKKLFNQTEQAKNELSMDKASSWNPEQHDPNKGTTIKEFLYLNNEQVFKYRTIDEHWNTVENINEIRMRKLMAFDYISSNIIIRTSVINVIAKNYFIFWQQDNRIWIEEKVM